MIGPGPMMIGPQERPARILDLIFMWISSLGLVDTEARLERRFELHGGDDDRAGLRETAAVTTSADLGLDLHVELLSQCWLRSCASCATSG